MHHKIAISGRFRAEAPIVLNYNRFLFYALKMTAHSKLIIALAQINPIVGDVAGNAQKILSWSAKALQEYAADIVVFPELALTGYPPEDLLFRQQFIQQVETAIETIRLANPGLCILFGAPVREQGGLYNCAVYCQPQLAVGYYAKQALPNYGVFDEQRYFRAGHLPCVLELKGVRLGITVCEDIWFSQPAALSVQAGAQLILNINASPFHASKTRDRVDQLRQRVAENKVPVCYVNMVGGQDELVFDGHSFVLDAEQRLILEAPGFEECLTSLELDPQGQIIASSPRIAETPDLQQLYTALVLATRDYVLKNGFSKVILGLSGGIDSALVLAIAVDALGADAVQAIMMPYHYTAEMSKSDAAEQARLLGVAYSEIAISEPVQCFLHILQDEFSGLGKDVTEENLQARSRGVILMAISNKKGAMLLTTGNKSEMSVGYATLYGDMAGGFAPLKDVSKLNVYALARYRNSISAAIPQRVIDRPPSAELAPDQKDQDSLPPYEILDPILQLYIEQDRSIADIIQRGYDEEVVKRVTWLVDMSEYKRRQSPPGVRVTQKAFGKERRYPITSRFRRS
jgi:NAD+ synthase (glutamine-hydrolysing)